MQNVLSSKIYKQERVELTNSLKKINNSSTFAM